MDRYRRMRIGVLSLLATRTTYQRGASFDVEADAAAGYICYHVRQAHMP
jgi:hypothetical protein